MLNHIILIRKLNSYGITGVALSWFSNCLRDRQQYIVF